MYGKIREHLRKELADIKAAGLYKNERVICSPQRAEIDVAGKKVLNFCAKQLSWVVGQSASYRGGEACDGFSRLRNVVGTFHLRMSGYTQGA